MIILAATLNSYWVLDSCTCRDCGLEERNLIVLTNVANYIHECRQCGSSNASYEWVVRES